MCIRDSFHPDLKACLEPTYGVIVYQEQVMQIAQTIGGYTLGSADLLRRAMGKKKPEEMAQQRDIFVDGAQNKGYPVELANKLFDLMAMFAEYGFNKSHTCLLYTSDAADERSSVDLGGRRILKKKNMTQYRRLRTENASSI